MTKCVACGKFLSPAAAASCTSCPCVYHKVCVAISDSGSVPKNWVCPECKKKVRKGDNTNTPVKGTGEACAPSAEMTETSSLAPVTSDVRNFGTMRLEIVECISEIRACRQEMAEFRASLGGIAKRLDELEQRLDGLEQKNLSSEVRGVSELQEKVAQLTQDLNDRDQDSLMSDLDIGCLTEEKGENMVHTVLNLATKLGVKLDERDIVFAERVGAPKLEPGVATAPNRTRRVVVRFTRRHLRDELIRAARVRRNLTTSDMGLSGTPQRVYINERLTRINRLLFHQVREECRKRAWRYSWTRKGRIYIRQGDGKQVYLIRSESDFPRVFGSSLI